METLLFIPAESPSAVQLGLPRGAPSPKLRESSSAKQEVQPKG